MARNLTIIQGSVAAFDIVQNDPTATSATLYLKNEDTNEVISGNASYVANVASIELDGLDTSVTGVYRYQVNESLSGGGLAKYGAIDCDSDGDCDFNYIIVCESLDGGIP